jgi:C-terminal processing protease CtpA/Prc
VLASSATAGAAEDLLAAFRSASRGVIIGEPSGGSPGDVATFALPKSWAVQFSVTRHEAPDGVGFAGVGVKPHIVVIRTVNDLLAGNEPALEKAREYLKGGLPPP